MTAAETSVLGVAPECNEGRRGRGPVVSCHSSEIRQLAGLPESLPGHSGQQRIPPFSNSLCVSL